LLRREEEKFKVAGSGFSESMPELGFAESGNTGRVGKSWVLGVLGDGINRGRFEVMI
jgi:hypothetical protein